MINRYFNQREEYVVDMIGYTYDARNDKPIHIVITKDTQKQYQHTSYFLDNTIQCICCNGKIEYGIGVFLN